MITVTPLGRDLVIPGPGDPCWEDSWLVVSTCSCLPVGTWMQQVLKGTWPWIVTWGPVDMDGDMGDMDMGGDMEGH